MSNSFQQVMLELSIQQLKSSDYHPFDPGGDWDEGIYLSLFTIRGYVQESLGFSHFELVIRIIIQTPDRRKQQQLCHIHMLKPYFGMHLILLILCILYHLKILIVKFKLRMNIL